MRRTTETRGEMTNMTFSPGGLIYDPGSAFDPDACQGCGLAYEKSSAQNRRRHAKFHDEAVNGVPVTLASYSTQVQVARREKAEIYCADESTPLNLQKKLAEAAQNANSETHYDGGVFHVGDIRGKGARFVWALEPTDHDRGRIVGLLIGSRCNRAWNLPIDSLAAAIDGRSFSASGTEAKLIRLGIAFFWVLRGYRGRGLASLLVRTSLSLIGARVNEVAFQKPFTPAGARVILQLARAAGREGVWVY
jgi:hypothetical protein